MPIFRRDRNVAPTKTDLRGPTGGGRKIAEPTSPKQLRLRRLNAPQLWQYSAPALPVFSVGARSSGRLSSPRPQPPAESAPSVARSPDNSDRHGGPPSAGLAT